MCVLYFCFYRVIFSMVCRWKGLITTLTSYWWSKVTHHQFYTHTGHCSYYYCCSLCENSCIISSVTQQGAFQSLKEKTLMISEFRDKCLQNKCKVGKYISSEIILFGCIVGNIPPILHVRVHLLRKLLSWKQFNIFRDPAELLQNYSIDKQCYWLCVH